MAMPIGYEKFTPGVRPKAALKVSTAAAKALAAKEIPNPFELPDFMPATLPSPELAMDGALCVNGATDAASVYQWASDSQFEEGVGFLGLPYLAQLVQRAEYRKPVEIIAEHATRKWIKLKGGESQERLEELEDAMDKMNVRTVFRQLAEYDCTFGRAHLYINTGDGDDPQELATPLAYTEKKIAKGGIKGFRAVDPLWCYPGVYNSTNPLSEDFYRPASWYVMAQEVHRTRLITMVSREVPDILKPAYAFGGLALTQMGKPYVDNWLRARQSASDLLHSFSVMVLKTNMGALLQGRADTASLLNRLAMFNDSRDNKGTFLLDKDTEDFDNVSASLTGVHEMIAQAQEQQSSVFGIPLVILLGITPSGLNASSDGEVRTFYATIKAYQERLFRDALRIVIRVLQLHLWGAIDDTIDFDFADLWEMDEEKIALINKTKADTDAVLVDSGIISQEEARERLSEDDSGPYGSVNLSGPPPEEPEADFVTGEGGGEDDGAA